MLETWQGLTPPSGGPHQYQVVGGGKVVARLTGQPHSSFNTHVCTVVKGDSLVFAAKLEDRRDAFGSWFLTERSTSGGEVGARIKVFVFFTWQWLKL